MASRKPAGGVANNSTSSSSLSSAAAGIVTSSKGLKYDEEMFNIGGVGGRGGGRCQKRQMQQQQTAEVEGDDGIEITPSRRGMHAAIIAGRPPLSKRASSVVHRMGSSSSCNGGVTTTTTTAGVTGYQQAASEYEIHEKFYGDAIKALDELWKEGKISAEEFYERKRVISSYLNARLSVLQSPLVTGGDQRQKYGDDSENTSCHVVAWSWAYVVVVKPLSYVKDIVSTPLRPLSNALYAVNEMIYGAHKQRPQQQQQQQEQQRRRRPQDILNNEDDEDDDSDSQDVKTWYAIGEDNNDSEEDGDSDDENDTVRQGGGRGRGGGRRRGEGEQGGKSRAKQRSASARRKKTKGSSKSSSRRRRTDEVGVGACNKEARQQGMQLKGQAPRA